MKKITAIIPARYGSTRFEGKALADILGRPMIQHVYERVTRASLVSQVLVATDDNRIAEAVSAFGGLAVMTSAAHETGTDRLAEVSAKIDSDIIVNVQGDEPLIEPDMIDEAIYPLISDQASVMSTLKSGIRTVEDFLNPNVVKVVTDQSGNALYFSRAPIPQFRDRWNELDGRTELPEGFICYKHVGLYAYKRDFLIKFAGMPQTFLEKSEKLEQLRAIENGYQIKVVETSYDSVGVDTPEDLQAVLKRLKQT
ncbi:MAG: 3-deoxy-manno-octulosonate cytidylyltransferase [Desulfuromonadales bacterium]|nr:3-deoxy-manno-octulosonate cytidylyltransferase [Desulfuromonadales bacterium]